MTIRKVVLILLTVALFSLASAQFSHREVCDNCIPLDQCASFISLLAVKTRENLNKLRQAGCGYSGRTPKVCCPPEALQGEKPVPVPKDNRSLLPKQCGESTSLDRIIGGEVVPIGSYTWVVALGYIEKGFNKIDYMCGASLINDRHILTAAHCVDPTPEGLLSLYDLVEISLGDWDLTTNPDCQQLNSGPRCVPESVSRKYENILIHPSYNTRGPFSDDIALIKLDAPVEFSPFIQPICLPLGDANVRTLLPTKDSSAIVVGWGLTEKKTTSDVLLGVRVPLVDFPSCNQTFRGLLRSDQVCFGGTDNKDSCNGDSGGPIFVSNGNGPPYTQIGLVSFGVSVCGTDLFPAVYTYVPKYRTWIEQNLTL